MNGITIAIPSGRLFPEAFSFLQRIGFVDAEVQDQRQLLLPARFPGSQVLIAKPVDLLAYVEHGAADAGIAGKDILLEQERDVYELLDLGFGACRGVVAVPQERVEEVWASGGLLRVATKYPRTAEEFFWKQGRPVEIIEMHGSVELAPRVGLADAIVDLVMTGQTLRANGLVEVAEVFQSTARLVVNRVSLRTRSQSIQALLDRIEEVLQHV
ncbi:MAG: ATP phosphoribosyltransferase [Armatimonadota bacterium]|nr:ATP phosphoribosyltransferase [Armatimonadota bacterium]